jgi:hypothetical protein
VGKFSHSDTYSGFFFQNLLEDFQAATGTGSGMGAIQTLIFFCQFDPGIWIKNAMMEE